jgi:hypothetical protein
LSRGFDGRSINFLDLCEFLHPGGSVARVKPTIELNFPSIQFDVNGRLSATVGITPALTWTKPVATISLLMVLGQASTKR